MQQEKPIHNIIYSSAVALARAIRAKQVSSEEVVNAYLKRMRAVNPKLNAVVQETADTVCELARAADEVLHVGIP